MSRKYRAKIPFIPSMGSVSPIVCNDSFHESKEENLLWELNKMREHDGLLPFKNIPRGVKWEEILDTEDLAVSAENFHFCHR